MVKDRAPINSLIVTTEEIMLPKFDHLSQDIFALLFLAQNRNVPATNVTPPHPALLYSADHSNAPWVS